MEFRNIVSERIVSLQMEIDSLKNEVADLKKMVTMPQEKPALQEVGMCRKILLYQSNW